MRTILYLSMFVGLMAIVSCWGEPEEVRCLDTDWDISQEMPCWSYCNEQWPELVGQGGRSDWDGTCVECRGDAECWCCLSLDGEPVECWHSGFVIE